MFDVGFSEMVVIAIVALIVIGPERLPGVARTIGTMLGRIRRYANDVKAEVNRELQLEDVRKMQQDMAAQMKSIEQDAGREMSAAKEALELEIPRAEENHIHAPEVPGAVQKPPQ